MGPIPYRRVGWVQSQIDAQIPADLHGIRRMTATHEMAAEPADLRSMVAASRVKTWKFEMSAQCCSRRAGIRGCLREESETVDVGSWCSFPAAAMSGILDVGIVNGI